MRLIFYMLFFSCSLALQAQTTISGTITDKNGRAIQGANVYLEGTYDGSTSAADGSFRFETSETGNQTLIISFVSFMPFRKNMPVDSMEELKIELREDVTALDAVVLNAGSFSAGDNSRVSVLKPIDVVTTAGVAGDFIAALQTLPGTQTVGENGRLFVRGGTAEETQIFIDGLRVFQPYTPSPNNVPARGRYSPFLFDGITFSTGGYSAEFGQALSSVLLLNTINEPDQTKTDISLMSVGAGLGHTQKWEKSSISVSTSYLNLAPYQALVPNNEDANFTKPFQSVSGEAVFRQQFKNGLLKFYTAYDHSDFEILQPDINSTEPLRFNLNNNNLYTNLSYKGSLGNGWRVNPGLSLSHNTNEVGIRSDEVSTRETAANLKLKVTKKFDNRFKLDFGGEYIFQKFDEDYLASGNGPIHLNLRNAVLAGFIEADLIFSKNFAAKAGVRGSYLDLNGEVKVSPRFSLAYKVGSNSQLSLAYGKFSQQAQTSYLKYDQTIQPETAVHYILNYQWTQPGYTFRAEAFYKTYDKLVTFNTPEPERFSDFGNTGEGYAGGMDFFFRDNKTFTNLEYWVSYSFIDSERLFRDYPEKATPNFVASHAASLVTKYWVENWRSQVGFTYNFSSGRPYENPNTTGFLNERIRNYNNLSFNWAYLLSQQKILYLSISNITGSKNIFNYEFSNEPDEKGIFNSRAITQAADRFFFIGFFWTLSSDKKSNQLDNL